MAPELGRTSSPSTGRRPSKLGVNAAKVGGYDSHAPCLAGSFVMRMTVKVTTNLGHASTTVEGPHGL